MDLAFGNIEPCQYLGSIMILAILIMVYSEINQLLRMRQKSPYGEESGEDGVLVHCRQMKASGCPSEEAGIFEDWMPNSKINP